MTDEPTPDPPSDRPIEGRALDDARLPGWRLEHLATTPSTNAVASAAVAAGAAPGLVVVTDHQTAGRGRLDRGWETPAGVALTFSAVVDPGVPDARWPWLPLLAGLAVAAAVRRATGAEAAVKWPNDVLVGDRKLAGILVERVSAGDHALAVVGIGINVHQTEPPVEGATSLALEGWSLGHGEGGAVDRADLLEAVLERLAAELAAWRADTDPGRLHAAYLQACSTIGRDVALQLPGDRRLTGRATTVDEQGRLVVSGTAEGTVAVGAGDVIHVRPTPR